MASKMAQEQNYSAENLEEYLKNFKEQVNKDVEEVAGKEMADYLTETLKNKAAEHTVGQINLEDLRKKLKLL